MAPSSQEREPPANPAQFRLAERFNLSKPDPAKLRSPVLKGLERADRQFKDGQTKSPHHWWQVRNGVVAFTVKVRGDTFDINGVATNHFPVERWDDFVAAFRAAVEAGEFDDVLLNKGNGDAKVHIGKDRAGGTRQMGEQSRTNIRVSAWRRAKQPKSDAEIRAKLKGEGIDDTVIEAAIARPKA